MDTVSALDLTRAIKKPSERRALVEAVFNGGAEIIETDFLEWKSEFDLTEVRYRAATAKHILAFANRHPHRAQRNLEGYGYLLLGVEPAQLLGVPEQWDPEKLESWLTPYVGGVVAWDPHFVELNGQHVLVITVDPPRWGDPPHPFRKESNDEAGKPMRAGTMYIRRPGKSEQADAADIDMLAERARAGGRQLSLSLELITPVARATTERQLSDEYRDEALRRRTEEMLHGVPQQEAIGPLGMGIPMVSVSELRSPEQFRSEVKRYIEQCRKRWPSLVAVEVVEARLSPLQLRIRNDSDQAYESVQVEVTVPVDPSWLATGAGDAHERFKPPDPPGPWGNYMGGLHARLALTPFAKTRPVEVEARKTEDGAHKFVLLRFEPLLVRPRSTHPLSEVLLILPPALVEAEIPLRWRATSASTSGEIKGELVLPVVAAEN